MAHFAQIDENNIVTRVLVIEQEAVDSGAWGDPASWIQTSYNSMAGVHYGPDGTPDGAPALRKNFAGIGYTYDRERDAFISPKPYPSWILDEASCCWKAPVPCPKDGKMYVWDEPSINWAIFVPPQPYPSWTWNEGNATWDPPTLPPNDQQPYVWDEPTLSWVLYQNSEQTT